MKFSRRIKQPLKQFGIALASLLASSAALQADAWCVKNGTATRDGLIVTATSNQFLQANGATETRTLKPTEKTCSVALDANGLTTVSVTLSVKNGTFGCAASGSNATCTEVCANDTDADDRNIQRVKLLGKVDLIVNAAEASDPQGQWKTGDLIVDYVYNDGKNPDRYRFDCRRKVDAAANRIKR
jgi:hypothetical protein